MHDAADGAPAFLPQDGDCVVFGFAGMDDDGQVRARARVGSATGRPLLHVLRREVVVVVEADLADGPRCGVTRDLRPHDGRRLVFPALNPAA